ncbi:MAG: histone deacetylase [Candidatus Hadarchaeales archaeon]
MRTALVYSERYLEHVPSMGHPERPDRLASIVQGLRRNGLWGPPATEIIEPKKAQVEDLLLVHTEEYIEEVRELGLAEMPIDGDTPVRKNTFEIALLAAGGTICAGAAVINGEASNSFALVRPPGHHAFRDRGGGFCYFNNIAIMTRWLQERRGILRVAIVDYDAHHGNGTQSIFYEDPSVLYISLHQHPTTLYPGSGFVSEKGAGEGEGYTVNIPMRPGSGDGEYASAFEEVILPILDQFKPNLIAVSAGFDSHRDDPLTGLGLSSEAYGWITGMLVGEAERHCRGRLVVALEGGYDLDALAESAKNVVLALKGKPFPPPRSEGTPEVVREVKKTHSKWWRF